MRRMAPLLISSVFLSLCSLCSLWFKTHTLQAGFPIRHLGQGRRPLAYSAGAVASAPVAVSGASLVRSRASSAFAASCWRAHMSA